jgi:hypothetical protein
MVVALAVSPRSPILLAPAVRRTTAIHIGGRLMFEDTNGIQGMRRQDAAIFHDVCITEKIWMLVRFTNPDSLKYIGDLNYFPKPIDCKPKTAKRNVTRPDGKAQYDLRGLVADPVRHPAAFGDRVGEAQRLWGSFAAHFDLESGRDRYKVDLNEKSNHFGCLMVKEGAIYRYLHGDYDLKDIVEVGREDWNLAFPLTKLDTAHNEIFLMDHDLDELLATINRRIGVPMLQHSSEAQFADHTEDKINAFGPNGEFRVLLDLGAIRGFYEREFPGRGTLSGDNRPRAGTFIRG